MKYDKTNRKQKNKNKVHTLGSMSFFSGEKASSLTLINFTLYTITTKVIRFLRPNSAVTKTNRQ